MCGRVTKLQKDSIGKYSEDRCFVYRFLFTINDDKTRATHFDFHHWDQCWHWISNPFKKKNPYFFVNIRLTYVQLYQSHRQASSPPTIHRDNVVINASNWTNEDSLYEWISVSMNMSLQDVLLNEALPHPIFCTEKKSPCSQLELLVYWILQLTILLIGCTTFSSSTRYTGRA